MIVDEFFLAPYHIWRKLVNRVAKCVADITRTYPGHLMRVQWVLCGDVYQGSAAKEVPLLDVVEFFSWAKKLKFKPLYLREMKRFKCPKYVRLIKALEQRDAGTIVPLLQECYRKTSIGITLTCTNKVVDAINKKKQEAYAALPGAVVYSLEGGFTAVRGSKVMVLRNTRDNTGGFVAANGDMCTLESMVGTELAQKNKQRKVYAVDKHLEVDLVLSTGKIITLPSRRMISDTSAGGKRKREDDVYEMPLTLGDAITIYKAQGETYRTDITVIVAGMFEMSQLYVALSRGEYLSQLVVPHFDSMLIDRICAAPPHPRIAAWHVLVQQLETM
jgi:hypothetical protein